MASSLPLLDPEVSPVGRADRSSSIFFLDIEGGTHSSLEALLDPLFLFLFFIAVAARQESPDRHKEKREKDS